MKNKKKYWYIGEDGKRHYVSRKADLPYKERKRRNKKKAKLSEKEKYRRKVEAARKRSESLKKFYESKEGEKLKKKLSEKAKERAKRKKEREQYPMSQVPVEATTALDRVYDIINELPNEVYFSKGQYVDVESYKERYLDAIEKQISLAEVVDKKTGEILVDGKQAYNNYLEQYMSIIENIKVAIEVNSQESIIVANCELLLTILLSNNYVPMEANMDLTDLQRYSDYDAEQLMEELLSQKG